MPAVATAPLSSLPDLAKQPERVRQLVALLVQHATEICATPAGMVELHYHEENVSGKHVQFWARR